MEQNELIENNVLIFDFMGCVHSKDEAIDLWEMSGLQYHNSWNLLMHVISQIKYGKPNASDSYVPWSLPASKGFQQWKRIEKALLRLHLEQTYNRVIDFITWYNSTAQTNGAIATKE